jgi:translation elongation factor EF-4
MAERVMDSNALERERGITILAKNTAIRCMQAWLTPLQLVLSLAAKHHSNNNISCSNTV